MAIQKNDYTCIAFFPMANTKKWVYVGNLWSFSKFLNGSHSSWIYFNVYNRRSGKYLTRFLPGDKVPVFV